MKLLTPSRKWWETLIAAFVVAIPPSRINSLSAVALAKAGQPSTLRSLNHFFKLRAQHRFGSCCESMLPLYGCVMSTAREIEEAIRSLPASERDKLLHTIPDLFPELSGDAEWERIIHDERPRPSLSQFLDKTENEFRRDPGKFAELRDDDFASHS